MNTFSSVPLDWCIAGGIVIILTIDSLRSGIGRTLALALAAPLASVLFSLKDTSVVLKDMSFLQSSSAQAVLFAILLIICFILLRRMGIEFYTNGIGEPVQAILASTASAALLLLIWIHTPALQDVFSFGSQLQTLFSDSYRFLWALGALTTLGFVRA